MRFRNANEFAEWMLETIEQRMLMDIEAMRADGMSAEEIAALLPGWLARMKRTYLETLAQVERMTQTHTLN